MAASRKEFGQVEQLTLLNGKSTTVATVASVPAKDFESLKKRCEDFLSPEELNFFRARQFERKQRSYLGGRYAAKLALGEFTSEYRYPEINVYPGVFEQPLVRMPSSTIPGITISHCDDLAMAMAFPLTHPTGIDVEIIDPAMVTTMKSQMCPSEIQWTQSDEANRCALIWTAKEALSKALKCGLTTSFELLEVEHLETNGVFWQATYRNFKQYRCYSWLTNRHALSITIPMQLEFPAGTDLRPLLT